MRSSIEAARGSYNIYTARSDKYRTEDAIPFRVSPKPFELSLGQQTEIESIGQDVVEYFHAVDGLYRSDSRFKSLLDSGKPEVFLVDSETPSHYLFVRPDLIITPEGFSLCEIETSPFGLALAEILNRGYRSEGFETLVSDGTLAEDMKSQSPTEGMVMFSNKTSSYSGQLSFIADELLSGDGRNWGVGRVDENADYAQSIYRGFYLGEYQNDPNVRRILKSMNSFIPSLTPHMEEKACLALIWDKRYEDYFRRAMGNGVFSHLRNLIPPTWIVGQEEFFAPGMPSGIARSLDLAGLSKSKRTFVLKTSGFDNKPSWGEGVNFLNKKSGKQVGELMKEAVSDTQNLYIVQELHRGLPVSMEYESGPSETRRMLARVRLTPYFSVNPDTSGKMVAIKATGCENTDYIHATSTSINTAVG